jgi:uncharacterized protein YqhQ
MIANGKSCEFSIFVLFCFFVGYKFSGVFMTDMCMVFLMGELRVVYVIGQIFLVGHQSRIDGGGS